MRPRALAYTAALLTMAGGVVAAGGASADGLALPVCPTWSDASGDAALNNGSLGPAPTSATTDPTLDITGVAAAVSRGRLTVTITVPKFRPYQGTGNGGQDFEVDFPSLAGHDVTLFANFSQFITRTNGVGTALDQALFNQPVMTPPVDTPSETLPTVTVPGQSVLPVTTPSQTVGGQTIPGQHVAPRKVPLTGGGAFFGDDFFFYPQGVYVDGTFATGTDQALRVAVLSGGRIQLTLGVGALAAATKKPFNPAPTVSGMDVKAYGDFGVTGLAYDEAKAPGTATLALTGCA